MKHIKLSLLLCIIFVSYTNAQFIFRIETTTNNQVFAIPADGSGINYNVDWGDTNSDANVTGSIPHTYVSPGEYTITITGNLPWFRVNNNAGIKDMILSIEQWGDIQWQSMEDAFYGCSNLVMNATDVPDLSNVFTTSDMFRDATSLVDNGGVMGDWNVGNVSNMFNMFRGTTVFNTDISQWNVSNVENFSRMFQNATGFDQSLGDWDISSATGMNSMFVGAGISRDFYDQTLGGWAALETGETQIPTSITINVGNSSYCNGEVARNILTSAPYNWVITDNGLSCGGFDGLGYFITTWQTSTANETITIPIITSPSMYYFVDWGDGQTDNAVNGSASHTYTTPGTHTVLIFGTFSNIAFNNTGDKDKILSIEQWGNIEWESMENAFAGCSNLVLNATDVPDLNGVTNMNGMFFQASSFVDNGGEIRNWDVSGVQRFQDIFNGATAFNQSLGSWDISSATDLSNALNNSGLSIENYDATLIGWATLDPGETQIPININLDANTLQYCFSEDERTLLTNAPFNWTINGDSQNCDDYFITTWLTTSANETITIPTTSSVDTFNYTVFWGDGEFDTSVTDDITHTYTNPGIYTVAIRGDFPAIFFNGTGDRNKILSIEQWGNISWGRMTRSFLGCTNLVLNATDTPNLTNVSDMDEMFRNTSSFVDNGGQLNNWDVGNVETMFATFRNSSFNEDVSSWDVSKVVNFEFMFESASNFNQSLEAWDISSAISMTEMLSNSGLSTENYDATLIGWSTLDAGEAQIPTDVVFRANGLTYCNGASARNTLANAPFNWVILSGDTLDCSSAFVTSWETTTANETITIPTVSGLTYNYLMDWGDGSPVENITTDMSPTHLYTTSGIHTVSITGTFPRIRFNNTGDKDKILAVENWGITKWSSMEDAFFGCSNFTINATDAPDLSDASSLRNAFRACSSIQSPDLSNWDVSTITNMSLAFRETTFNGNVTTWDVGNVTVFNFMFYFADNFNQNISGWNIGENVSGTITMYAMFEQVRDFNQPIGSWDMSKVTSTGLMFGNTNEFNQPLDNWDVSNVTNMFRMFDNSLKFNQNLGSWDISSATNMERMLDGTNLSVENYDSTLIGWATLDAGETQIPTGISIGANGLTYCISESERETLTNPPFNWTISGDTLDCTTLSTDDVTLNTFSLYPNPVSDILNIENTQQKLTKIEILDIAGKKVYSSTINLNEIDMQSLDAGLYLIKLFTETSRKTLKIIKK